MGRSRQPSSNCSGFFTNGDGRWGRFHSYGERERVRQRVGSQLERGEPDDYVGVETPNGVLDGCLLGANGCDEGGRKPGGAAAEVAERRERGPVGPLEVVDQEHEWAVLVDHFDERFQYVDLGVRSLRLSGRQLWEHVAERRDAVHVEFHLGERLAQRGGKRHVGKMLFELGAAPPSDANADEAGGKFLELRLSLLFALRPHPPRIARYRCMTLRRFHKLTRLSRAL